MEDYNKIKFFKLHFFFFILLFYFLINNLITHYFLDKKKYKKIFLINSLQRIKEYNKNNLKKCEMIASKIIKL